MVRTVNITMLVLLAFLLSCKRDAPLIDHTTQKLVIVLADGPRWTERGGDPTQQYQPFMRDSLAKEGCVFSNFYNNGVTLTVPGHTALLTGHYQNISNGGNEYPMYPSLGQTFIEHRHKATNYSWLISSKDKIEVLKTCQQSDWNGMYTPRTDCGNNGLFSGYRLDSVTFERAKQTLLNDHPDFLFVGFKEPDVSGHMNNWQGYLDGIKQTDKYAWEIWKLLQASPYYKGVTTFVMTNDHGRHIDGRLDGFVSHGDTCVGCRHINLFMAGPGIKKNTSISQTYEQIDLHKTLSRRFGLFDQYSDGKMIKEINAY